ncbi:MAG: hypothetical protein PVF63_06365 [Gammaproteobacteria bacterium]|jgi:hypothetical protein
MSLEEIGIVGELFGSLAVVVTLIYVALQLRQNTQAIRAAAVQSITETVATNVTNIAANPENASVFRRGLRQFPEMSETEQAQFALVMNSIFLSQDGIYWLYRNGSFPEELWQRELGALQLWLASEGGKAAWDEALLSAPFRDYVNTQLQLPRKKP